MGTAVVEGLEHKDTTAQRGAGEVVGIDESRGLVTAIVSVTGVEDQVKDIIEPGSYRQTLTNRRPKVVQHHDWRQPVARVEEVVELRPGDARLPAKTSDGRPWPREAGALLATMQYNLNTAAGRDAFETVKFYSKTGECQWSIGYKVPKGKSTRRRDGVRQIKSVDLYEISFVLFGAAPLTGTLAVKSDTATTADTATAADTDPAADAGPADTGAEAEETETAETETAEAAEAAAGAVDDDVAVPLIDDADPDDIDWEAVEAGDHLFAPGDLANTESDGDEEEDPAAGLDDEPEAEPEAEPAAEPAAEPESPGDAPDGPADPAADPAADPTADPTAESGDAAPDVKAIERRAWYDTDVKRMVAPDKRRTLAKRGQALPDGSYPIENAQDLRNAIRAVGRAKPQDRAKVRSHITKRARALGLSRLIPDSWSSGKSEATALEGKGSSASLDRSPRKNWVEATGELPRYVREVARSIHQQRGMPLSQAIPIAISRIKKWAAGGDNVDADTRAKAAKAVAEWEQLKAKARAKRSSKAAPGAYDPAIEVGPEAGHAAPPEVLESSVYPHLPGTHEEVHDLLHRALSTRVFPARGAKSAFVSIDGTWDERVVATYFPEGEDPVSYEIGYDIDAEGKVWLGEPEQVTLTATLGEGDADGSGLLPHPAMLEQISSGLRTALLHESKAGRVLSAVNARRLRGAVEQLIAVLEAAGIPIGEEEEIEEDTEPVTAPDSTAPSARPQAAYDTGFKGAADAPDGEPGGEGGAADAPGAAIIDPKLHARLLNIFAAANGD